MSSAQFTPSSKSRIRRRDETQDDSLRSQIRQDYIDAVFGNDFFPLSNSDTTKYEPPRQGMGLAQIPHYVTYQATIPPPPVPFRGVNVPLEQAREPKLGLTLSKLALGLYVQAMDPKSEAIMAGIQVGSILVSINGMGMLAEDSRHALERLWQYEGLFHTQSNGMEEEDGASASSNGSNHLPLNNNKNNTINNPQRPKMQDPIALTFIKDAKLYTAILVSGKMGIQWASCGNFCLVNRAYSYASSVGGVRRGSIIASVNGVSLRAHDDYSTFGEIMRQVFQDRQQSLHLWLAYTPQAARTGYWERLQQQMEKDTPSSSKPKVSTPASGRKKTFTQKRNGVEIRVHSFEESWQSLWRNNNNSSSQKQHANNTTPTATTPVNRCGPITRAWSTVTGGNSNTQSPTQQPPAGEDDLKGSVAELANRVVEGEVPAPTSPPPTNQTPHWSRQQRLYGPCPPLHKTELIRIWDPLQALMFCLESYQHLLELVSSATVPTGVATTVHNDLLSNEETTLLLKQLATENMIQTFLWQFISLIASSHPAADATSKAIPFTTTAAAAKSNPTWTEEKKEETNDALTSTTNLPATATTSTTPITQTTIPHTSRASTGRKHFASDYNHGEVLTSLLLKLSRKDQDFCQRLYFCLRSTLKSLDSLHETIAGTATSGSLDAKQSQQPQPESHLLALFNCLQLLRSAEREALMDGSHQLAHVSVEQQWLNTSTLTTESYTSTPEDVDTSMDLSQLSLTSSQKSESKRRMFGFFRKNKSKNKKKKFVPNQSTVVNDASLDSAPSLTTTKRKTPQTTLSRPLSPRRLLSSSSAPSLLSNTTTTTTTPLLENMSGFVKELDGICTSIEKRLLKSISQKIADWALQPWSASKSSVLTTLTEGMRQSLRVHTRQQKHGKHNKSFCLVNPLYSQELLVGVDPQECFILPSAHFPILLTFDAMERQPKSPRAPTSAACTPQSNPVQVQRGRERSYRIVVEVCNLSSSASRLVLHGAIGGGIQETASTLQASKEGGKPSHAFRHRLQFKTRSSWGAPRTLSVRLSSAPPVEGDEDRSAQCTGSADGHGGGFGWIDLLPLWNRLERFQEHESYCTAKIYALGSHGFDDQGSFLCASSNANGERLRPMRLECKVTVDMFDDRLAGQKQQQPAVPLHKRMLLYKHDDDLRQEAFAIQFVKTCDTILKASGLDLKLLTFGCIPVGGNRGFIEWVEGSVPLSDICQRPHSFFGTTSSTTTTANNSDKDYEEEKEEGDDKGGRNDDVDDEDDMSMIAKAGMTNYESLYRMGMAGVGNAAASAMKNTRSGRQSQQQIGPRGSLANNPIQDFLRSIAFDAEAPYFVCRQVMDTYVKSCAGYCVITYLLGVGDRHLDNLLLHNFTGCFFHCDYSFLFGKDPKKYLPMRVTEDMIYGMGGRESDNYAKFLSLTGSAFVTLRQAETVRLLLSLVRVMEASRLPDFDDNVADVVLGLRQRMRLDLSEEQAVAFMEELIEGSLSSKLWMAVDAIHSLGKRF